MNLSASVCITENFLCLRNGEINPYVEDKDYSSPCPLAVVVVPSKVASSAAAVKKCVVSVKPKVLDGPNQLFTSCHDMLSPPALK